ncbi:MAG: peptidoglycan DD-metalloendopeptidase family protein [Ferruginibacter sp.]
MIDTNRIVDILQNHSNDFSTVVPFNKITDKIFALDLSKNNTAFTEAIYSDEEKFEAFISNERKKHNAAYLIGGYREHREMYRRSNLFDKNTADTNYLRTEPRSLHLGVDVWADAGTKIFAALGGIVHSFAYNNNFGDYGATIILQHQLKTFNFYTLYGHLALKNIEGLRKGKFITRGENFANFGPPEENGNWPPHLHFQIILDMGINEGDYPGVCKLSEADKFLHNSPDGDLILKLNRFLDK